MTRRRRVILGVAIGTVLTVLVVAPLVVWMTASRSLKPTIEAKLTDQLGLPVTIESLTVTWRPRPTLWGTGLVVRVPSRPDLEPFIDIAEFHVAIGPLSVFRGHVGTVHVGGLKVFVPPGGVETTPGFESRTRSDIIVDHLEAHDAELTIVQRQPDRDPMLFRIQNLRVDDVGFGRRMPFAVDLTNYLPEGQIHANGSIGPWRRGDPAGLPV